MQDETSIYFVPRVLSARKGYSADHSTACYHCVLCDKFYSMDELGGYCTFCGSEADGYVPRGPCSGCEFNDGECDIYPAWCDIHARELKFIATREIQDRIQFNMDEESKKGTSNQPFHRDIASYHGFKIDHEFKIKICLECYEKYFLNVPGIGNYEYLTNCLHDVITKYPRKDNKNFDSDVKLLETQLQTLGKVLPILELQETRKRLKKLLDIEINLIIDVKKIGYLKNRIKCLDEQIASRLQIEYRPSDTMFPEDDKGC